jgi:hypothetical protein
LNDNIIYRDLKLPFSNMKQSDKIVRDVDAIVHKLKEQNMNKDELTALKSSYSSTNRWLI